MENCERTDSEAAGTMWEKREKNRAGAGSEMGRGNRWIGGEDGVKEIKFVMMEENSISHRISDI